VSELLSWDFPIDEMNQLVEYEHVIIPEWHCEDLQSHSYTDRFLPSLSRYFAINHPLTSPSYYQYFGLSVLPLKCLAFDDISRAEGEPIIHQRLRPCLDDPKQFKLEYLRARARCFYPLYIIPELTSPLLPIEKRVADETF